MPAQLRPDVVTSDTHDGLVLLDERSGRYWQLNHTSARVLRALLDGQDVERIAADLAARHRLDPDRARRDVAALTERLTSAKLVRTG
ncbi:MAG TPA: lasso peptide biosynthesis PqqD family chaperone [Pseudonocardia sp.]|jgi:hypothetical protein|nr:lasso peptide biosynthesis PqqD family chaperone [Pseudonocardia sp.]